MAAMIELCLKANIAAPSQQPQVGSWYDGTGVCSMMCLVHCMASWLRRRHENCCFIRCLNHDLATLSCTRTSVCLVSFHGKVVECLNTFSFILTGWKAAFCCCCCCFCCCCACICCNRCRLATLSVLRGQAGVQACLAPFWTELHW